MVVNATKSSATCWYWNDTSFTWLSDGALAFKIEDGALLLLSFHNLLLTKWKTVLFRASEVCGNYRRKCNIYLGQIISTENYFKPFYGIDCLKSSYKLRCFGKDNHFEHKFNAISKLTARIATYLVREYQNRSKKIAVKLHIDDSRQLEKNPQRKRWKIRRAA